MRGVWNKAIDVKCLASAIALLSFLSMLFIPMIYPVLRGESYGLVDSLIQLIVLVCGMGCLIYAAEVLAACEIREKHENKFPN